LASVVIASLGQPVSGWVSKISPVPDSTGGRWGDPDRKDYPIDITLDWTPAGLRPGMSGRVSVLVDQAASVQSMPIAALYTAGNVRYAFVPDGNIARPVEIKIGRTNEQDVEIVSGLDTGTAVILLEAGQGKVLLERAGINVDDAASKNGQANDRSDNRKAR